MELIYSIEPLPLYQALCETQSHGGIISPFPWGETERTAADHVCDWAEASRLLKLERSADRVAGGKAQQAPTVSFRFLDH